MNKLAPLNQDDRNVLLDTHNFIRSYVAMGNQTNLAFRLLLNEPTTMGRRAPPQVHWTDVSLLIVQGLLRETQISQVANSAMLDRITTY